MAHRSILTERQRSALFDLPIDELSLLRHYTLADDDLDHINARRRAENRIGFALQLCALRYPGRLLSSLEVIPEQAIRFIGAQLGLTGDEILPYAARRQTRQQHLQELREIYGYKMFSGRGARDLKGWLEREAETARSNEGLARRFVEECRRTQTVLPGVSVIERLCADALVAAERRIESRITDRLNDKLKGRLDNLLTEMVDGTVSRFIWLRQFEVRKNSAGASRLLDRLEFLQEMELAPDILEGLPPHRVTQLRRQGERYFADGLRDITSDRRLAILAVCAIEWHAGIADAVVETHDRIVGKTWQDAKRLCDTRIADAKSALHDTLRSFKALGAALLEAKGDEASLDVATEMSCGWLQLEGLVATAAELTNTMSADPIVHVVQGYHRFRRYAPRMLRALDIHGAAVARPLEQAAQATPRLTVPFDPESWLEDRKARLTDGLDRLAKAARSGAIPGGSIENGVLKVDRLPAAVPEAAEALVLALYDRLPAVRITDLLQEVDEDIGFTDAFTNVRTGSPCTDRIGLLTVLLAEGLNLGLSKMAEATNTHDYMQLSRLSRWHIESDAINRALAIVIDAQAGLPMAKFWGGGVTASSDGQFFPAARQGEAMNLINAKYGSEPGLKAYTHVSDQFGPFATQNIPATVSEAPYILDGLLMNEAGRKVKEQYADTGGFTDHVFAVTSLLAFRFIPRIRDLPSKRLYLFDPAAAPKELRGLIGGKIREGLIIQNWPDILRAVATMAAGIMPPSQLLKKFAAYPRQHELALALREIGRIERTLFIIDWLLDADMQRRAQIGLNKGEAHHALKNALRIGRQGEIRDRTVEGQHYRMAGLNLLAAIIIYWNTKHLGQAVTRRQHVGLDCPSDLLGHISPLGWAHILLTGEYKWKKR